MSEQLVDYYMANPEQARKDALEKFITERTKGQQMFDAWVAKWDKYSDKFKSGAPYNFDGASFKDECPEFYKEVPDAEVAQHQLDTLNAKLMAVNEYANNIQKEGILRLVKYNETYGGRS